MDLDFDVKILLVEDSGLTRKMEVKVLKQAGFTNIIEAEDGSDAIGKLETEDNVGLIISDWNMPNKDGYELLLWVRADEKCKDIPFIMATAQGMKKQTEKAVEAGVSNFVTKPFGPPELKKVVEDTFSGLTKDVEVSEKKVMKPVVTPSGKLLLKAAHIQITDHLVLGVLKHMIESEKVKPKFFELETACMPGWNPVQDALEEGEVGAACILAPIAMDLFSVDTPIRLVLFAHKNGSIFVRKKKQKDETSMKEALTNKTFYLPHILSIHHMLSNMFLKELGLEPGMAGEEGKNAFFEIVPPVKMPEYLGNNEEAGGFMVAEPLGTKTIASGTGDLMFLSGRVWDYHPCCVVVMRDEIINDYPDAVQEFVNLLVEAGQFISRQPGEAAQIAVDFLDPQKKLGLNVAVLKNVLKEPLGIKTDDLFPVKEDLDRIQNYMSNDMGVSSIIDLDKFVEERFAQFACDKVSTIRRSSVMHDLSKVVTDIVNLAGEDDSDKAMLDKIGKYLIFELDKQEYGFEIYSIKEILQLMPITEIPQTPDFFKGCINLRGKVIPVIDLRVKLGMESQEYHDKTCIIVIETGGGEGLLQLGVVVDSVSEVMNIKAENITETPQFLVQKGADYVNAMAKINGGVKILLNTGCLVSESEKDALSKVAQ